MCSRKLDRIKETRLSYEPRVDQRQVGKPRLRCLGARRYLDCRKGLIDNAGFLGSPSLPPDVATFLPPGCSPIRRQSGLTSPPLDLVPILAASDCKHSISPRIAEWVNRLLQSPGA